MFRLVLSKVQELLQGPRKSSVTETDGLKAGQLRLVPLPVAVRVDSALPLENRGNLKISRLTWVSPTDEGRPSSGKLQALFYPN
jgi:hypothetical protein